MRGKEAVCDWEKNGWGKDKKTETTLTKILTAEEILKKIDELTSYYENYFEKNKVEIEVEISAPQGMY